MEYANTRVDLLRALPKGMIIAELGVFKGEFSEDILKICRPKELHLIDLWDGVNWNLHQFGGDPNQPTMEVIYEGLVEKYTDSKIVKLHKGEGRDILNKFPDNYFDFIYVDADHLFENVYADLRLSWVKSNRYVGLHDFCSLFLGVIEAVKLFMNESGFTYSYITNQDTFETVLFDKGKYD